MASRISLIKAGVTRILPLLSADRAQSRCRCRRALLDRCREGCSRGHQCCHRPSGAPGLCRTGPRGGVSGPAPPRPAVSPAGRGPGGPAARRGVSGPARRPRAVDAPASGRHAERPGPRGPPRSGGWPHPAQQTARTPGQHTPWGLPPPAHAAVVGAMAAVRAVSTRPDAPQRP